MKFYYFYHILFFLLKVNKIIKASSPFRYKSSFNSETDRLFKINNLHSCDSMLKNIPINYPTEFTKDVIMAHRGLWGFYPEHSIRGFELAYFMGAHYLETDVNLTKDKKLIIFHDPYLDDTTDIADHTTFHDRKRNETIDGIYLENKFFVSDFTYDELLTLYTKQRNLLRPQIYNKEFKILLIEDLIEMVLKYNMNLYTRRPRKRENAERPNTINSH